VISKSLAKQIARSGAKLRHVQTALKRGGTDGLCCFLRQRGNKCRFDVDQIEAYLHNTDV